MSGRADRGRILESGPWIHVIIDRMGTYATGGLEFLHFPRGRSRCSHDIYVVSRMGIRYIAPRSL
jgi:hypothetical protein